jgi:predicted XRE-type DNA-binding protein
MFDDRYMLSDGQFYPTCDHSSRMEKDKLWKFFQQNQIHDLVYCNSTDANMFLQLNLFSTFLTLAKSNNLVQVCGILGVSKSQISVLFS